MEEARIGVITHFFHKPMVAAIRIEAEGFKVGDKLHFKGHTTEFFQVVESMEVEHRAVPEAKPGDLVGIGIKERVREHDLVYKVVSE